jgi:hypothetical protein
MRVWANRQSRHTHSSRSDKKMLEPITINPLKRSCSVVAGSGFKLPRVLGMVCMWIEWRDGPRHVTLVIATQRSSIMSQESEESVILRDRDCFRHLTLADCRMFYFVVVDCVPRPRSFSFFFPVGVAK